jgi:trimeric autotransporter adhesin
MAQTGFTPIQLYSSSTPTNAPSAGNLTNDTKGSELAINIADKNLFFKDSTNAVNTVPIRQSGTSSNGWLSATDWNTFNNKQPAGAYVTSVTGTAPVVSSGGTTPAISMAAATTSVNGYLTSTDWNTFNNKQAALVSGTNIKTVSGTTLLGSGDLGTIGVGYGGTGTSTAFTAGSVVFAGASGVYSQDNANLFWSDANNRLGIGNASPSQKLHIGATADASNYFQISGASMNAYFGVDANGVYIGSDTAAKSVNFYSAGTERMRIPAAGGLQVVNCVSVGNATPAASGAGVTFPATASASSDANTLDDYEEGTWTATLTNISGGTVTNTNYVKVGRLVTARLSISGGTYVANSSFFSLPFACVALTSGTFSNATIRGGFLEAQASSSCYFSTSDSGNVHCSITYITS